MEGFQTSADCPCNRFRGLPAVPGTRGRRILPGQSSKPVVVSSFLDEKYGGEIVSYDRYDSASGNFIYKCTVDGKPCEIGAKNFKIRYDGYYHATAATSLLKPSQKIIWIII